MTRIRATSMISRSRLTRWTTRKIAESSKNLLVRSFLRFTDYGLVSVTCYLSNNPSDRPETLVEMCNSGYSYSRWYEHGVISESAAARLATRFLNDVTEAYPEVQP